jgi:hypothetical protein
MAESSLARSAQEESPEELVECFRHEGEECPRCDGSGYRPRKYCAGCGEPSSKPSEGGRALIWVSRTGEASTSRCGACIAIPSIISSTPFGPVWKGWAASVAALFTLGVMVVTPTALRLFE